jgi:carbonic anhydrase/acetyltransferase-like protein (isoleucine patch superfamily)
MSGDSGAILQASDASRRELGFLTIEETAALAQWGVHLLDPFSPLGSPEVEIEAGAVLHPTVTLHLFRGARIRVGAGTRLCPGVSVRAEGGSVVIGRDAEIGDEGGFFFKTSASEHVIEVGDRARLTDGGSIIGSSAIGDGAQILGRIAVRNCSLAAGGDYNEPDPDRRGAVLKGSGQARGLTLDRGRVIQAFGIFAEAEIRWQSFFHPPAKS